METCATHSTSTEYNYISTIYSYYRKSQIFRVYNISCDNFSRQKIFGQTTLYCIVINIAHVFCAFNFRTSYAVRKYFNIEIFAIYGMQNTVH